LDRADIDLQSAQLTGSIDIRQESIAALHSGTGRRHRRSALVFAA